MEIDALKVKILLAEQKKTQAQLASECCVTRQNISRVLTKGRCNPPTVGKLAMGLGVPVAEILKEEQ